MSNLENIFKSFEKDNETPIFRLETSDEKILFIHDSYRRIHGETYSFTDNENSILTSLLETTKMPKGHYQFIPAIGGFNLSEDDVSTSDLHKHREALYNAVEEINPDLIIPLGNLAFRALTKKSGVSSKRGREFPLTIGDNEYTVVPTLHPYSLYAEPKLRGLFVQDINNAYDKFILGINKYDDSPYELIMDCQEACDKVRALLPKEVVAIDLETNGLDFKKHQIFTIGFSSEDKTGFVIPIHHAESPFDNDELSLIKDAVKEVFSSKTLIKVLQNCKFDLKFLMNWDVKDFNNIEDTQIMHALVDENLPHGLMDMVKQYYPQELEKF